ncbi:MAG TPA: hypothetical protein VMW12_06955 [Candidatus Dormibacteraeota bacterium]|nr:hypothetical protein [Candidatus Dormibacteraeota bacterium]
MNGYVIGAGALLRTEPRSGIAAAALHAQTDPGIAAGVKAAIVDFEASSSEELSQVLIVAAGWSARRFESEVTLPLLNYGECSLLDVLALLAKATGSSDVHIFARWLPDEELVAALARCGVEVVAHPLEAIAQAALISGASYTRWPQVVRAA